MDRCLVLEANLGREDALLRVQINMDRNDAHLSADVGSPDTLTPPLHLLLGLEFSIKSYCPG